MNKGDTPCISVDISDYESGCSALNFNKLKARRIAFTLILVYFKIGLSYILHL